MDGAATVIHQSLALPYSSIHSYSETSETLKFTEKVILNRQTHTGRSLLEILQLVFAYLPQAAMTFGHSTWKCCIIFFFGSVP